MAAPVTYQQQSPFPGYGYDDPTQTDASFVLTVTPGSGSLALSWPSQTGVLGYDVFLGTTAGNLIKVASLLQTTTKTISGLIPGRIYWCQVVARMSPPTNAINSQTVTSSPTGTAPVCAPDTVPTCDSVDCGTPTPPPPGTGCALTICPAIDFGCVTAGTTSAPMTTTIKNNDSVAHTITQLVINDPTFVLVTPPTLPLTIAAGATQDISVEVLARAAGVQYVSSLTVYSDAASNPNSIELRATTCTPGPMLAMEWQNPVPDIFVRNGTNGVTPSTNFAALQMEGVDPNGDLLLNSSYQASNGGCQVWPTVMHLVGDTFQMYGVSSGCGGLIIMGWETGYVYPSHKSNQSITTPTIDAVMMTFRAEDVDNPTVGYFTNNDQYLTLKNIGLSGNLTISAISGYDISGNPYSRLTTDAVLPIVLAPGASTKIKVNFFGSFGGFYFSEYRLQIVTDVPVTSTTLAANVLATDKLVSLNGSAIPAPGQEMTIAGSNTIQFLCNRSLLGAAYLHVPAGGTVPTKTAGDPVTWGPNFAVACITGMYFKP